MSLFRKIPNSYFNEVEVLSKFTHSNFIQKLISSFYDYDNLYFVSKFYDDYVFNYFVGDWYFNEKQIQFFSACIIQALINLRREKYIHRDIHFANLVMDKEKYISLIDFHITIEYTNKNNHSYDIVGSPALCAPEMVNRKTYEKSLNLNIKNYIGNNQNKLSYDTVTDLMSKI